MTRPERMVQETVPSGTVFCFGRSAPFMQRLQLPIVPHGHDAVGVGQIVGIDFPPFRFESFAVAAKIVEIEIFDVGRVQNLVEGIDVLGDYVTKITHVILFIENQFQLKASPLQEGNQA
jgi:hypothetical protein